MSFGGHAYEISSPPLRLSAGGEAGAAGILAGAPGRVDEGRPMANSVYDDLEATLSLWRNLGIKFESYDQIRA